MKLSVVIPVHNQHSLSRVAIHHAIDNLAETPYANEVEIIIIDNGSNVPFVFDESLYECSDVQHGLHRVNPDGRCIITVRLEKNIGVYPTFWAGMEEANKSYVKSDVLAFLHSDLIITEKNWDKRVLKAFEGDAGLGMVGFIGSDEIDSSGGRGRGTMGNFQGDEYFSAHGKWKGSPWHAHGRNVVELHPAAVVDGCAMVFRRSVLEKIKQRPDFPPHHFYDRLLSCEVQEWGFRVGVLGIACDHISGQTVNQEEGYDIMARAWCEAHGISNVFDSVVHNWDSTVYNEAERLFLAEYRDQKNFIPRKVYEGQ